MMPNGQEVASGLRGAWRLLRCDAGGMAAFDNSVDGFWKSFYAAVLTAPAYVIVVALHMPEGDPPGGFLHLLLIQVGSYVIEWVAYPLAAFYVVDMMSKSESYIRFIVALNWSRVVQVPIYLPAVLLVAADVFAPQVADLLTLITTAALLAYQWFVTRTALAIPGMAAALLVALDVAISVLNVFVTDGLLA